MWARERQQTLALPLPLPFGKQREAVSTKPGALRIKKRDVILRILPQKGTRSIGHVYP